MVRIVRPTSKLSHSSMCVIVVNNSRGEVFFKYHISRIILLALRRHSIAFFAIICNVPPCNF